jgi:hypothetical protein
VEFGRFGAPVQRGSLDFFTRHGLESWSEKNPLGSRADSTEGEKVATAVVEQQRSQSTTKPPFWIEGEFGLCVYARLGNGSEPCYLNMGKELTKAGIDGAISFLKVLREELDK